MYFQQYEMWEPDFFYVEKYKEKSKRNIHFFFSSYSIQYDYLTTSWTLGIIHTQVVDQS